MEPKRRHIDLKRWEEYTESEKVELLAHWWYYFGKMIITVEELALWHSFINETPDCAWNMAVLNFTQNLTSQPIIASMRQGRFKKFSSVASAAARNIKMAARELWDDAEQVLLLNVVSTYNDPEPAVPFSDEKKMRQVSEISGIEEPTILNVDLDEIRRQAKNI